MVAVKLLRPEYADHPEALARFRAEARHAAGLCHPGIAQVYDYGDDGQPFLVMELVNGPSLAAVLARTGPLDARTTMDVTAQAATALGVAHAAGLVHRDIMLRVPDRIAAVHRHPGRGRPGLCLREAARAAAACSR
jgi:serine/threonine-protein kinase